MNIQDRVTLPDYYQAYLSELEEIVLYDTGDVNTALGLTFEQSFDLFSLVYPKMKDYRYEADKWSIIEIIGHLIDVERVFVTRALRLARGDQFNDASFDHDLYVNQSNYKNREWDHVRQEFLSLQEATGYFFEGLSAEELDRRGTTNNMQLTPRTIGFMIAAHRLHHFKILKDRYLND